MFTDSLTEESYCERVEQVILFCGHTLSAKGAFCRKNGTHEEQQFARKTSYQLL